MELQLDRKKKNSMDIDIPVMVQAKISFEFHPSSPYGIDEALMISVDPSVFGIPLTERGNSPEPGKDQRRYAPLNIPYNTSEVPQKITVTAMNKVYHGARTWLDSDSKLLRDKPFEKVIGFNTVTQPDNYEVMKCTIVFYL